MHLLDPRRAVVPKSSGNCGPWNQGGAVAGSARTMTKPTSALPRQCVVCGTTFRPPQRNRLCCSLTCSEERRKAVSQAHYRVTQKLVIRDCLRCGKPLEARSRKTGNRLYCSEPCKVPALGPVGDGVPCQHCGRLFTRNNGKQRFCGSPCRVAQFKAKHAEQYDGEIPVVDIDEAPRRLAVAKLFDRFEGGGGFNHFEALTWVNPADRRTAYRRANSAIGNSVFDATAWRNQNAAAFDSQITSCAGNSVTPRLVARASRARRFLKAILEGVLHVGWF
jgi:hypothetical protein